MIILYKADLSNFIEIAQAESVDIKIYDNDIGKFSIVLPQEERYIAFLEKDGVIYDTERDVSLTVQNFKFDNAQMTISIHGYSCSWLLDKRVIASPVSIENVEEDVYSAINGNLRNLPHVRTAEAEGFTETAESLIEGGQLLTELMPVLKEAGISHEMAWDTREREHVFRLYKGRDLTEGIHAVTFSEEQGTAENLVYTSDAAVFKNVVYVQGELSNDTVINEIVGDTAAADRRELWLTRVLYQEQEESEAQLRARMQQEGLNEIAERVERETFEIVISPDEYGKTYRLGDWIKCASVRLGIQMRAKVTGVHFTQDQRGKNINLILGEQVLTALGEARLNGRN